MFYVYELCDPRTGQPFYIGKGKGRRLHQHAKDARRGVPGRKCDFIRELQAEGLEPDARIIRNFADEREAFAFEAELIEASFAELLNIAPGGYGGVSGLDPVRDARKFVLRFCTILRRALDLFKQGVSVSYKGFDFVSATRELALRQREIVGAEFFDRHVGVA